MFDASRSYNLLYFIYARKASQILVHNLICKIYATVEIHVKLDGPVRQEEAPEKSDEDNTTKLYVLV